MVYTHILHSVDFTPRVLLGAEKSFVFIFDGDAVTVRKGVQLSHLTPVSTCIYIFITLLKFKKLFLPHPIKIVSRWHCFCRNAYYTFVVLKGSNL